MMLRAAAMLFTAGTVAGFGQLCGNRESSSVPDNLPAICTEMPENTRVAMFGDQGYIEQSRGGIYPRRVLQLMMARNADFAIHLGDFDYNDNPAIFDQLLDEELPPDFPYFANIGNHDLDSWEPDETDQGYHARLTSRLESFGASECCWGGEYGVNRACLYKGLLFVLSGVGTRGSDHAAFIDDTFATTASNWKMCTWHKNQRTMQIGGKSDEVGWEAYETCLAHGAIVATGHEHSYCRSHLMNGFEVPHVISEDITLSPGESFVFVSGIGGRSLRAWNDERAANPWWASVGATNNDVADGLMFCDFYVHGDPDLAHCWFESIDDAGIWDEFDVATTVSKTIPTNSSNSRARCAGKMLEVPVGDAAHDAMVTLSGVSCDHSVLALSPDSSAILLYFAALDIASMDEVQDAYLQVYGAAAGGDHTSISIRAAASPLSGPPACSLGAPPPLNLTVARTAWAEDDGEAVEWERHEVWVVSVKAVLAEVVNHDDWVKGSSLTLHLTSSKGNRSFYAHDHSKCVAPTLAISLKSTC